MKRRFALPGLGMLALAACCCLVFCTGPVPSADPAPGYYGFSSPDGLRGYLWGVDGHARLISAHRGGPGPYLPENALKTFEQALTLAPCVVECDVRACRDGILVLMHDATLDRTTNGNGAVAEHSLSSLRSLRLRDPAGRLTECRIPTLGEALEWARRRCVLTLDVKEDDAYPRVVAAVGRHRARGYAVVIVYSHEQARRVHEMDAEIVISAAAASPDSLRRLLGLGIPPQRLVVFVGTRLPPSPVLQELRKWRIPAILGTMNHLDRRARVRGDGVYLDLYRQGIQVLSTDQVRRVARALAESGKPARMGEKQP